MFEIAAKSRFINLKGSVKLYYVLAVGIFVSLLSYLLYRDLLVTLSMILTSGAAYYILSQPPKDITIQISDEQFTVDQKSLDISNCRSWGMVNLGEVMEFVVSTTLNSDPFIYFYVTSNSPNLKTLISIMAEIVPFDEQISKTNRGHLLLREFGLR